MNLEYSFEFHSLCQEIDDEKLWIKEKYAYLETQEFGSDLTGNIFMVYFENNINVTLSFTSHFC